MTRAPSAEEPCVAKVTSTVLKASGGGDPFAEPNRAGMRWSLEGAQAMLDLRSIHISGQWDEFTAHRIRKETERLYPHAHRHPRPRLSLVA
jgi:hypothetical protein